MRIAPPQGQSVALFQCSTSGRCSWEVLRFCRASHRSLAYQTQIFGCKRLSTPAYQPCHVQLGSSGRYCRRRRLNLLCSAEDSTGNGGSGGNSADSPGKASSSSSTNTGRDESAPERRPRSPKSGRPWSWLLRLAGKLKIQNPLRFIINLAALAALMRFWPMPGARHPLGIAEPVTVQVAFSEFVKYVRKAEVGRVMIDGNTFAFTMKPHSALYKELPESMDRTQISFQTIRPKDYPTPYDTMLSNGIQFSAVDKKGGRYSNIMTYAFWAMLLVVALNRLPLKLSSRGAGRRHSNSSSGGSSQQPSVTFDDVAGVDEAKEELKEVVDFLKFPDKFSRLGARPPSGVLLIGPPGTGKTLLAKAVAGEAEVPFFSISASEFVELYVGMGAMRVRELFAAARKEAPAIVFIDEIDAVAKGRDSRLRSVGNDEREQTLNQLLTELDGFETQKEALVICIAATNRPDVLDPALLRPGRFDRRVAVERPDRQGRAEILRVHIGRRQLPLDTDVSVESLAAQTTGFTGADLANLVNEAALLAGRGDKGSVGQSDFDHAVLRAVAGVEKKRSILKGLEKSVVARHEIGHALVSTAVAAIIPGSPSVEKLSIIPRSGGALGFTYIPPATEDRALLFDSEIRGQLAMLMGGRAAEELTCDSISTGAVDDIRRATDLAYKAVSEYGLNAAVGPLSVAALGGGDDYGAVLKDSGSAVARMVEQEVRLLCEGALWVAREVVVANRGLHDELSAVLEREEKMEGASLRERLCQTSAPELLRRFVLKGEIPEGARSKGVLPH